ncbi:MAG: hypothetical protein BJ554DRAFT_4151, partial [Olpidium bornovanus]
MEGTGVGEEEAERPPGKERSPVPASLGPSRVPQPFPRPHVVPAFANPLTHTPPRLPGRDPSRQTRTPPPFALSPRVLPLLRGAIMAGVAARDASAARARSAPIVANASRMGHLDALPFNRGGAMNQYAVTARELERAKADHAGTRKSMARLCERLEELNARFQRRPGRSPLRDAVFPERMWVGGQTGA